MKRRVGKFTVFNKPRSKTGISVQNFKLYNLYKQETVSCLYIFSSGFHCQDKAYHGRIYNIEL